MNRLTVFGQLSITFMVLISRPDCDIARRTWIWFFAILSGMNFVWAPSSQAALEPALPVSPERCERFHTACIIMPKAAKSAQNARRL
jgi:hypothetical protein